jgi:hypothetical protein
MQTTSQLIQETAQASAQGEQSPFSQAQTELNALQLALVGGGNGNAAFG